MEVKDIIDVDTVNYKELSMFIATASCTFKCDKEAGCQVCQNSNLANAPDISIHEKQIVERYYNNPLTSAVVIGGLEPFDAFPQVFRLIGRLLSKSCLYNKNMPTIVIYTGYTKEELEKSSQYPLVNLRLLVKTYNANIIIKYGRFIPDQESHYDEILGVKLASPNQYAERLEAL